MKFLFLILLLALFASNVHSDGLSCRDVYRCTSREICYNGQCVSKDAHAGERRRQNYGYRKYAKKIGKVRGCEVAADCDDLVGRHVCRNGACRLISY
ncbi:hypothetical protein GCK72_008503 [Caenorhabditis remanei]|uniref:EB domain-containing protein n=1 Tax=Caenorhabditis remanei TaxID=31234 RepID=A0A6A5GYV3_CAERE|nr:hypothetical protein GCK72_008503 [Caenorhabditis remanei]KAF1760257.1 hypothetical protein GCK72_008503 [Caenorhabditis remanei]